MAKNKAEDQAKEKEAPEQEKTHKTKKEKVSREQELENQLAEKNDQLLRLAAEYANFRRRSADEKLRAYSDSKADVVKELLPVIDNFERSQTLENQSYPDYKKGMDLIYSQFLGMVKKLGIETFGEPGEDFDPNIHSAVMHVEDDSLDENVIAEVLGKGYKLGEKIIRSATVKVAN